MEPGIFVISMKFWKNKGHMCLVKVVKKFQFFENKGVLHKKTPIGAPCFCLTLWKIRRTGFCLPDLRRSTFADGLLPISTFADHPYANPTFADLDICRSGLLPINNLQTSVRLLPLWTFAYQTFADWDFCLSDFCRSRLLLITRKIQ